MNLSITIDLQKMSHLLLLDFLGIISHLWPKSLQQTDSDYSIYLGALVTKLATDSLQQLEAVMLGKLLESKPASWSNEQGEAQEHEHQAAVGCRCANYNFTLHSTVGETFLLSSY